MQEEKGNPDKGAIVWHTGFCSAIELELRENREQLSFEREHQLGKEPLRIDMLVIMMQDGTVIRNELGSIFRRYNILEYKSPKDQLGIDEYFKAAAYVALYKAEGGTANERPFDQMTLTLVRETLPQKLFAELRRLGCSIEERAPGIFMVQHAPLAVPTQIVVSRLLSPEDHSCLRVLSPQVDPNDIRIFLAQTTPLHGSGDRSNADAVLQISMSANQLLFEQLRRDSGMCVALRDFFKDELAAAEEHGIRLGEERGINRGRTEMLIQSIINLQTQLHMTAEQAMTALQVPAEKRDEIMALL